VLATDLHSEVRAELLGLNRPVAETVSRHLVAAGRLLEEEPELALAHALAARRLASRIAPVREAVGLAAYRAGEWQTAVAELRTYHRMTGRQTHLAVLADCERALGRPERAIDIYRGADRDALGTETAIELLMVAAGARGDLGQPAAAVAMLQVKELTAEPGQPWTGRLRYAYADALLGAGRKDEAREWFARAAEADENGTTDAAERLLELDGVVFTGDDLDSAEDVDEGSAAEGVNDSTADEDADEDEDESAVGSADPAASGPGDSETSSDEPSVAAIGEAASPAADLPAQDPAGDAAERDEADRIR
jgi:tetratricopeptide (TPR) repeat protein